MSALKETGRFSKVELDVKPDPGGLRVTFTLEPALYFGIFQFPGATKSFSYTRLLQVIDIPNQTPYQEGVVAKAGEALLQFLISAGYFQAQVQTEPQFDEAHMLADVGSPRWAPGPWTSTFPTFARFPNVTWKTTSASMWVSSNCDSV